MGSLLSRLRGKKETSKERLEAIDKELKYIQRFQIDTELKQKRIIGKLWIYSAILYVLSVIGFYFFAPRGIPWKEQMFHILPFVVFPFLMYLVKLGTAWYFQNKIVNNREKYDELKKEKQQILDDVMDNETFKVAKEILEKYAPRELLPKYLAEQQRATPMSVISSPAQQTPARYSFQDGIRRRQQSLGGTSTPLSRSSFPQSPLTRPLMGSAGGPGQYLRQPTNAFQYPRSQLSIMGAPSSSGGMSARGPTPSQIPSYMLPLPPTNPTVHNRGSGWLDKLVDYVVGDGATSRYALICRYCATHNGLATMEDFPYTGFRCVFCHQFNPPKQVRPTAPKLPVNQVLIEEMEQSSSTLKSETSGANNDLDNNDETTGESSPPETKTTSEGGGESDKEEGPIVDFEDSPSSLERSGGAGDHAENENSITEPTNDMNKTNSSENAEAPDKVNSAEPIDNDNLWEIDSINASSPIEAEPQSSNGIDSCESGCTDNVRSTNDGNNYSTVKPESSEFDEHELLLGSQVVQQKIES